MRFRRLVVALIASVGACALGRDGSSGAADGIDISLVPPVPTRRARVVVTGIDRPSLNALRAAPPSGAPWDSLFRVGVATDAPAIVGRYVATDTSLEFEPLFPLDAGRDYFVRVDPKRLKVAKTIHLPDQVWDITFGAGSVGGGVP